MISPDFNYASNLILKIVRTDFKWN